MIEILDFKLCDSKTKVANLGVRYHDLVIRCELVYYKQDRKAWIRMPEKWINATEKRRYCFWPSKEISDNFQIQVLNKIFDKYELSVDKIEELYLLAGKKLKAQKKK